MGYHLYYFYEDDEKLAKVLADFFMEGLRKLEYCMWIPRDGITHNKAIKLLKRHIPDIEDYLLKDQMYIEAFENWYLTEEGRFDKDAVMAKWKNKYDEVMRKGFIMMRIVGDSSSMVREYWNEAMAYEAMANELIGEASVAAVCTYNGRLYKPSEIQMILANHLCSLASKPL